MKKRDYQSPEVQLLLLSTLDIISMSDGAPTEGDKDNVFDFGDFVGGAK